MSQRTQCDRCLVIVDRNKQSFEMGVGPLRAREDAPQGWGLGHNPPSEYEKYMQLCWECHTQLTLFLTMPVPREPQRLP